MFYAFEVECDKSQIDAIHATTLSRTALQLAAEKDGATIMELVDTRLKVNVRGKAGHMWEDISQYLTRFYK